MIRKLGLMLVLIGICMGCAVGVSQHQPTNQKSLMLSQENPSETNSINCNSQSTKTINVLTSIEDCPKTAQKGQNVTLKLVITNKGTKPIYNVVIDDQPIHKTVGTIKSGETKKIIYKEYIWTDKEIRDEFGEGAKVSNPYPIGGFNVYYTDYTGKIHVDNFPNREIKLI